MKQPGYSELKRRVLRLVFNHRMIEPGGVLAVGASGGKDSTFMIHLLNELKEKIRWDYSIVAYRVVDKHSPCHNTSDIDEFSSWCESLEVPLKLIAPPAPENVEDENLSECFKCAWRRKEVLFRQIHADGIRTLALGHTAFDLAVTALMNMTFHGNLETMPPVMEFFKGEIKVIRPISVITERQVIRLHKRFNLPKPPPACQTNIGLARFNAENRMRDMLKENPHALYNVMKAARRWPSDIMNDQLS